MGPVHVFSILTCQCFKAWKSKTGQGQKNIIWHNNSEKGEKLLKVQVVKLVGMTVLSLQAAPFFDHHHELLFYAWAKQKAKNWESHLKIYALKFVGSN